MRYQWPGSSTWPPSSCSITAAAVDKLEVQTAEMAKLREEMDDLRRTIHAKDAEIAALEERLREMREAMGEVETLKAIIASLQKVLHEAMKAGTWQQCRQILYHAESVNICGRRACTSTPTA